MKLQKTQNAKRNIYFGTLKNIFDIVVPFIVRTVFIKILGEEYLGLNGIFSNILLVLGLAELGFGTALVYNMYQSIAKDDIKTTCALMNFYKKCYRLIGLIVLGIGLLLVPFLPLLISSGVPKDVNIYMLYGLHLASTVVTYWLFAYKNCLLNAHQRVDVAYKISIPLNACKYLLQLLILAITKNYYCYILLMPLFSIANNIIVSIVVDKMYPMYKAKGELNQELKNSIFQKVKALIMNRIGSTIVSTSDTLTMSAFFGATIVGYYSNYHYITNCIATLLQVIMTAVVAGIGNSLVLEESEKIYGDFKKFTFMNNWIVSFCSIAFLCLFQPFISLWIGDNYLLSMDTVVLICLTFFVWRIQNVLYVYIDSSGMWEIDRFRPLTVGISNLILNIILTKLWGLNGIFIASIIAWVFIGFPWLTKNVFSTVFHKTYMHFILNTVAHFVITLVVACVTFFICRLVPTGETLAQNYFSFVILAVICVIVPNILLMMVYFRRIEFMESVDFIKRNLLLKFERNN